MTIDGLVVGLMAFTPIVAWTATIILIMLARTSDSRVLQERAVQAVLVSMVSTVLLLVAINTNLGFPLFDSLAAKFIIRTMAVILGIGPLGWLVLYWRGA